MKSILLALVLTGAPPAEDRHAADRPAPKVRWAAVRAELAEGRTLLLLVPLGDDGEPPDEIRLPFVPPPWWPAWAPIPAAPVVRD